MIRLIISGHELEFSQDEQIALTYQMSDLDNPSTEKNSFSKSIEIKGTPRNNQIFGHIWKLDRTNNSLSFDPRKRVDATIYDNNDIIENGYIKMDKIKIDKNTITYSITFFGGIGSFFYNLMYDDNGDEITLADLYYGLKDASGNTLTPEKEDELLLAEWNKEYITDSWKQLGIDKPTLDNPIPPLRDYVDDGQIHSYLTAAPTYSGLYDDFDNDKVLTTTSHSNLFDNYQRYLPSAITDGSSSYTANKGWGLVTTARELDEWETGFLNSSQQKPAVKLSWILNACCNPINNGGYNVVWDDELYDETTALGKYYKYAYVVFDRFDFEESQGQYQSAVTLPSTTLTRLESSAVTQMTPIVDTREWKDASVSVTLQPQINIPLSVFGSSYPDNIYDTFYDKKNDRYASTQVAFRLKVYDDDELISTSPVCVAYANAEGNYSNKYYKYNSLKALIAEDFDGATADDVYFIKDELKASATSLIDDIDYVIYAYTSGVTIQMPVPLSEKINIKVESVLERIGATHYEWGDVFGKKFYYFYGYNDGSFKTTYNVKDEIMIGLNTGNTNAVFASNISPDVQDLYINKTVLFGNSETPYDYLTSFTKLMGLKYYYDSSEKTVHIMTRNNFFKNSIVNIEEQIDRGQSIEITPCLTEYKWYNWNIETPETYAQYLYNLKNKGDYGSFNLDTGYYFNKETEEIFEDNIFKNVIPYRLSSLYFNTVTDTYKGTDGYDKVIVVPRPLLSKTYTYTLWNESGETYDKVMYGYNGYYSLSKGIDVNPKVCCFDKDNGSVDCSNSLLLFDGINYTSTYINDNMQIMYDLNENPCHIWGSTLTGDGDISGYTATGATSESTVALLYLLPKFSKYHTGSNGMYDISLDFNKPAQTFTNDSSIYPEGITIYDNFWKSYISDIYDKDGKKVSLYAIIQEAPREAMRRFYYFDDCLWLLNKIEDYKPRIQKPLKCEFVKIMNVADFTTNTKDLNLYSKVIPRASVEEYTPSIQDCPVYILQKSDTDTGKTITLDSTYQGKTISVYIYSYDTSNKIVQYVDMTTLPEWITADSVEYGDYGDGTNTKLNFYIDENPSIARSTDITIIQTVSDNKMTVTVNQENGKEIISTTYNVSNIGQSATEVGSTVTSITVTWSGNTIITYSDGTTNTTSEDCSSAVTFDKNTTAENITRSGSIDWNGCSVDWTVTQRGTVISRDTIVTYSDGTVSTYTITGTVSSTKISNIPNAVNIVFGTGVTGIGDFALYEGSSLTSVTIPETVTYIGTDAFGEVPVEIYNSVMYIHCPSGITTPITIPDGITSISTCAFYACNNMPSVIIPNSVTDIGAEAFHNCYSLTSITIPNNVQTIGNSAFNNCNNLTSVTIPNSVQTIGNWVFESCDKLETVVLGSGITNLGHYVFDNLALTSLICYATTAPTITNYTFKTVASGGTLYYPSGSDYSQWLSTDEYYLGYYGWTGQEITT